MTTYKEWYNRIGYKIEEETREWLENAPDSITLNDLGIYCLDDFMQTILEDKFESEIGDYNDRCYQEWKERGI